MNFKYFVIHPSYNEHQKKIIKSTLFITVYHAVSLTRRHIVVVTMEYFNFLAAHDTDIYKK